MILHSQEWVSTAAQSNGGDLFIYFYSVTFCQLPQLRNLTNRFLGSYCVESLRAASECPVLLPRFFFFPKEIDTCVSEQRESLNNPLRKGCRDTFGYVWLISSISNISSNTAKFV